MNKIEFIQVTIEPWHYADTEQKVLKVQVRINGQRHNFERVLMPDEMTSFFDQLLEVAKEQIKAAIKNEELKEAKIPS